MQAKTAILIFTRTAQEEARQKWETGSNSTSNSRHIAQTLLQHTRRVAKATGYPVMEISSRQQQGASFGERLSHAITTVWKRGFEQVLVVGTDTPHIHTALLQQAAQQISPQQSVLGAATDGGAYLIGLHRAHFEASTFAALPWQQEQLFEALKAQLALYSEQINALPTLSDIDTWQDVVTFVKQAPASILRLQVRYYLQPIQPTSYWLPLLHAWNKNFTAPTYNRPPPMGALFSA